METKASSPYWGIFAEIYASKNLHVEEMNSIYDGPFAVLTDMCFDDILDINDYLNLAVHQRGTILELGCGSGRILLRLAEYGFDVTGVECSEDMLHILHQRLNAMKNKVQGHVKVVKTDMLKLNMDYKFSLIIIPCCTLALFPTRKERLIVLEKAAKHLAVGGILAFSYSIFNWDKLSKIDSIIARKQFDYKGSVGKAQIGFRAMRQSKCLLGNSYIEISQSDGKTCRYLAYNRVASMDSKEIDSLLYDANLNVIQKKHASLPQGIGERITVTCTHTPANNYPLWHPYQSSYQSDLLMLVEGKGCHVIDQHENCYIDATAGLWSVQCGYGHPAILTAITKQLEQLSYGTLFSHRSNKPSLELAQKLVSMAPAQLPWVYLTCSGSESVELAIKLARMYQQVRDKSHKKEIVFLDQSYHGTYFGSMGVTGLYRDKEKFSPTLPAVYCISTPDTERCPIEMTSSAFALKCANELKQRIQDTNDGVAAFIIEPVLGSAGMIVPSKEYFVRIQEICKKHDVLFIVDEVATGFGRTGYWFASECFNLQPDILLLAKGINSGYLPLGAVLFSTAIGQVLLHSGTDIGHGSSHNGNPACAAAALATIDVIQQEALVERANENGEYFRKRMQELFPYSPVKAIRGIGLMLAILLQQLDKMAATPSQVIALKTILQRYHVLCYPGPSSLIFIPPLIISNNEIDFIINTLHKVFGNLHLKNGRIDSKFQNYKGTL